MAKENLKKSIIITESQLDLLLKEGVAYTKNDDSSIDMKINHDNSDKANRGRNNADTRVFGSKHDVLYGDGTSNGHTVHLAQFYNEKLSAIEFYKYIIKIVSEGRRDDFVLYKDINLSKKTYTSVKKWFDDGYSDARIIDAAKKSINRIESEFSTYKEKYNRVNKANDNDKVMRYITSYVPNTNVKYIALFTISDFNFSDGIKHGFLRQNDKTDLILGIKKAERDKDKNALRPINVTYDDGEYKPDIAHNFSLKNVMDGHYKEQYGTTKPNGYSSINEFIDKSIIYANTVLKKEGFNPDFIVSVPSSSKFNDYYCTNLSNKLGVPYTKNFFQRNFLNVKFDDGRDISEMRKQGFSEKEIFEFSSIVKNIAYKEISYIISKPLKSFIYDNNQLFENISTKKNSRDKVAISQVYDCVMEYAYNAIITNLDASDVSSKYLIQNFMANSVNLASRGYNHKHIINQVRSLIKMKIGLKVFNNLLLQTKDLVMQHLQMLKSRNGYKPRFNSKRFKITQLKKQFRPFLHDVYVVADDNLNKDGELFKRYQNAKFLIFDEDINSGASLKCAIDALKEKTPTNSTHNIMCLVNAYSGSGY